MREILFRGYAPEVGWVEGSLLQKKKGSVVENFIFKEDEWIKVEPESVGQYLGKIDKNRKRIFEGDIIKYYFLIRRTF